MSDPARTILDNLKEQFAAYKKQTAVLVSLSIVLIAVVLAPDIDGIFQQMETFSRQVIPHFRT